LGRISGLDSKRFSGLDSKSWSGARAGAGSSLHIAHYVTVPTNRQIRVDLSRRCTVPTAVKVLDGTGLLDRSLPLRVSALPLQLLRW
jgi:hypothetical protein